MVAYYNEIDPAAAHILRTQIDLGTIAFGEVDTRSIKDVTPSDLKGFTQCHFFAGGGIWSVAARMAGWPDERPLWTGSCPCQPFSAAGKQLGTDDPRHLWPDFHRLISARRPDVVMGEQVAGAAGVNWLDGVRSDLEACDFATGAVDIPACSVNAPHQRQRIYWIGRYIGQRDGALGNGFGAGLERFSGDGGQSWRSEPNRSIATPDVPRAASDVAWYQEQRLQNDQCVAERNVKTLTRSSSNDGGIDLADAACEREGRWGLFRSSEGGSAIDEWSSGKPSGSHDGYWENAIWIKCHDGKARRAKSDIRMLVDGLSGRLHLWRLAGNAIVPQLAAEVIRSFLDTESQMFGITKGIVKNG